MSYMDRHTTECVKLQTGKYKRILNVLLPTNVKEINKRK